MKVSDMLLHGKENAITGGRLVAPAKLEDYMGSLDRRIRNVSRTWKHLEATLLRMTGQEKMGGC